MGRTLTRSILMSLGLILLAASAGAQETDEPREGGVTGTGITVVIGQSGLVEIAGRAVDYPVDMPINSVLGPSTAQALQAGDTVAVSVSPTGEGWRAQGINQILPLVGPVSSQTTTTVMVMGTVVARPDVSPPVSDGDWIAVSGFWRGNGVVATRLDVVAPQPNGYMQGTYQQTATGAGRVGNSQLTGAIPKDLQDGDVIRITGTPTDNGIAAQSIQTGLFGEKVQTVLAQGYLSIPDDSGNYSLLGSGITSRTARPEMIDPQTFVTVCGIDGNMLVADQITDDLQNADLLAGLGCLR